MDDGDDINIEDENNVKTVDKIEERVDCTTKDNEKDYIVNAVNLKAEGNKSHSFKNFINSLGSIKNFIVLLIVVAFFILLISAIGFNMYTESKKRRLFDINADQKETITQTLITLDLRIEDIKEICELIFAEIPYSGFKEIKVHSEYKKKKNDWYDHFLYIYRCVCKLGIDAKHINNEDIVINHEEKKILLRLPAVEVLWNSDPEYEEYAIYHSKYIDSSKANKSNEIYKIIKDDLNEEVLKKFSASTEENIKEFFKIFFAVRYPDYEVEVHFK